MAAYLLGPEKGDLSAEALARCDHIIKIPTKFCVNVSVAAAIVVYDRWATYGGFAERPVAPAAIRAPDIGPPDDSWTAPRRKG